MIQFGTSEIVIYAIWSAFYAIPLFFILERLKRSGLLALLCFLPGGTILLLVWIASTKWKHQSASKAMLAGDIANSQQRA
jgi:hypothetical protein